MRISFVVVPALAAAQVQAARIECALNMLVSIPAFARRAFSHLTMAEEETRLYGLIKEMKSWEWSLPYLQSLVFSLYAINAVPPLIQT